jgi:hypothetical protein
MKASVALRLGATMWPQAFGASKGPDDSKCALNTILCILEVNRLPYSWMFTSGNDATIQCPVGCGFHLIDIASTVVHLNDNHHCSREQIADWLETIEPAEPAEDLVEQTNEQTDKQITGKPVQLEEVCV